MDAERDNRTCDRREASRDGTCISLRDLRNQKEFYNRDACEKGEDQHATYSTFPEVESHHMPNIVAEYDAPKRRNRDATMTEER
jgi:hypothetical protein